jgi:hypothetical protein
VSSNLLRKLVRRGGQFLDITPLSTGFLVRAFRIDVRALTIISSGSPNG